MAQENDFATDGTKLEGQWENDRNAASEQLFIDIFTEVFGAKQIIIAHHLCYAIPGNRIVEEIPSADALIFDHTIMRQLFGDGFKTILMTLACEPVETRDAKLASFYYSRQVPK